MGGRGGGGEGGGGGDVCGLGGVVVSEFFDKESIFFGEGFFYQLTRNPNLTIFLFFFVFFGGEGVGGG